MQFQGQLSALRHRQFLKYWLGSFTSVGATQLQVMGLGWLVWELSSSSLMLGYLGAAAGIPAAALTVFGGALADRLDKRLVLMVTSLLTAALLALLTYLDYTELVQVWHVIVITGAISVVTGFDWPVRQSIFPSLIERSDMMSAVALTTVIWQATRMVMPAFGGIVIAVADTWLLFALCSAGFLTMFLVLLTIEVRSSLIKTQHSTLGQIREGLRFIVHAPEFLILITLSYAMCFFATSYMQLMPAFADMLSANEQEFGYMLSIGGIGAVVGTIISSSLQHSTRLGRVMLYAAIIYCLFIYLFAAVCLLDSQYSYLAALAMIFLSGTFNSIFMITSTGVLQLEVPDELRGRVMGLHAITYNMLPLGALFTGAIASISNPSLGLGVSTTIVIIYLIWILLKRPDIRNIDGTTLGNG